MKRVTFILILSVTQILECQCFDFRNLFGSYTKDVPSTNSQSSSLSSNSLDNVEKLENVSVSFMEDSNQDLNASISSINEFLDAITEQQQTSYESLLNVNFTYVALNGSEKQENTSDSRLVTSNEKVSSVALTSTESTTASSHVFNETDSGFHNITTSTEEPEEVVLGEQPSTITYVTRTIYQKTVDFMGDPYTLSIFIPIAAGVLFALTIILTIATCRCIRKKCRRRRFRKRVLPDSIKSLRPSDQARLLGDCCDSSDEF